MSITNTRSGSRRSPQLHGRSSFEGSPFPLVPWGTLVTQHSEKSTGGEQPLSVGRKGVTPQLEGVAKAADASNRKVIRPGDLAINSRSDRRGAAGLSALKGAVSVVYTVMKPLSSLHPKYAHHLLRSVAFQNEFFRFGTGIVDDLWSTRFDRMAQIRVPLPPLDTQCRIADFLDRETAEIDAMDADLDRLIEALQERRVVLVDKIVTGQREAQDAVNPEHNRDSSDVASLGSPRMTWQGAVPKEWQALPIGRFLRIEQEIVGEKWSSTQLLSLTKQGIIRRDPDSGEGKLPASFHGYQLIYPGDLVMCLFDMDETPRTVGLTSQYGMITNAYTRFSVDKQIADPRFVEWAFIAVDNLKRLKPLYTGLRKTVRKQTLLSEKFSLPPLAEQRRIADHLDRETAEIDSMIEDARRLKEVLAERRQVLISDVVTGRKEVPA